ncbi:hypothetical protein MTR_4g051470 [Medicago truncatula]|uniref:Uncharacterized protein n=1 Tax=Medicago truncatula TaxID=3880 RepID=G7JH67_MEDTR|nr:hypothetical protein MTR_4g051470 [Medicago truncatula]
MGLPNIVSDAMLKKVAAKSRKEAAKLGKAFEASLKPSPIPDGIVDFLQKNSPTVEESIKGANIINYLSQFSALASTAAPASSTPPDLHLSHAERFQGS